MRASATLAIVSSVLALAGPRVDAQEVPALRLGVISVHNPRVAYAEFQPLVDHLERSTSRPWELALAPTYDDMLEELCDSRVSIAYLGAFSYVRAEAACSVQPLVRSRGSGQARYRSYILVRSDSPYERLEDLRGLRFGFGDPLSTSAHVVPRTLLRQAGLEAGEDIGCRYYDHHEQAARAVLLGEIEACGVIDMVGTRFLQRGLRALARSAPSASFPVVAAPSLSGELREAVTRALGSLPADAGGRPWASELAGGFAPSSDSDYDPVRAQAVELFGADAATLPPSRLRCGEAER